MSMQVNLADLARISGKTEDQLNRMPQDEFNKLAADFADQLGGVGTQNVDGVTLGATTAAATTDAKATDADTSDNPELAALEQQKADITAKRDANTEMITKLQEQIDEIAEKVKEEVAAAVKKVEELGEEQKKNITNSTSELTAKLKNGEIDKSTYDEQVKGVFNKHGLSDEIQAQLNVVMNANGKISTIELLAGRITGLEAENAGYDSQLTKLDDQIAALPPPVVDTGRPCPDPIGFDIQNEDGSTVQYDFMIDRDGNGSLSNANEFLGATEGWDEMAQYMNEDGTLNEEGLKTVKVVVTTVDANGNKTQEMKPVGEVFKDLVISGRDENVTHDDKVASMGEGAADDNRVNFLSTFDVQGTLVDGDDDDSNDVKFNEKGYQTVDDYSYLDEKYEFSEGSAAGLSPAMAELGLNIPDFNKMSFTEAQEALFGKNAPLIQELKEQVQNAMIVIGFNAEAIAEITKLTYEGSQMEAEAIVQEIQDKIDADKAEKAAEEAKKAEGEGEEGELTLAAEDGAGVDPAAAEDAGTTEELDENGDPIIIKDPLLEE